MNEQEELNVLDHHKPICLTATNKVKGIFGLFCLEDPVVHKDSCTNCCNGILWNKKAFPDSSRVNKCRQTQ